MGSKLGATKEHLLVSETAEMYSVGQRFLKNWESLN